MSRILILSVLALAACVADVGDGKTKAVVEDVPATVAPVAPPAVVDGLPVPAVAAPKVLDVDTTKSSLGALGAKVSATHPITFHDFAGKVGLDGETVTSVSFAAKIATLTSDNERLTAHLVKPDFLDAVAFPHATFASTEVKAGSDKPGSTHTVTGDFTIRGVSKRITFPATITVDGAKVDAKSEFVINRQDFGVTYPGKPDDLVQDNVVMTIAFVAPR